MLFKLKTVIKVLKKPKLWHFLSYIIFVLIYCEFIHYYVVLWLCKWPQPDSGNFGRVEEKRGNSNDPLHAMLLADTHLLGARHGHWFDKLRREWQMYRTFQTARYLFEPDVIFILGMVIFGGMNPINRVRGDIFDEGDIGSKEELKQYLDRFNELFFVDETQKIYVVLGNHDIGFHYAIEPSRLEWFSKVFKSEPVELLEIKGNLFLLLNSMAMENDGCRFCGTAQQKLREINKALNCALNPSTPCNAKEKLSIQYSRPILLQHFPLFRISDINCSEPDEAPPMEKSRPIREKWDCLAEESTNQLLEWLKPRAAFGGHSHYGCTTYNKQYNFWEWTLSSFSWRNNKKPAFLLVTVTPDSGAVSKCLMPYEKTVITIYTVAGCFLAVWMMGAFCILLLQYGAKNAKYS